MTGSSDDDRDGLLFAGWAVVSQHRAGWSVGCVVAEGDDGQPVWIVSGSNGENLIRVESAHPDRAWSLAVDEARRLGMFGRSFR